MLKSFSAVTAMITLGCATALADGPLRLDAFTQIVAGTDGGCWNDLAKNELALYLGKITGKKPVLLERSQAVPGRGTLYLGSAAAASGLLDAATLNQVADEGFAVASDGANVAIYGRPGRPGMVYGVYAFLRRVGVEFYAENCEELPSPGATVPVFKLQANPAFDPYIGSPSFYYFPQVFSLDVLMRWGYSPYCAATQSPEQVMFAPGLLDQDFTRRYGKFAASSDYHVAGWLVPTHRYLKEHPEYYARGKDGAPLITDKTAPECVQLCLSNPDVYKIVLSRLTEWMDKTPAVKYYSLTVGDSWDYCQCPACRKLDPPNAACFPGERWPVAHMSDRYLDFVNRLARDIRARHPGKILLAGIYQPTCQPPQLVKAVEPNVRVILCPYYTDGNKCASHGLACPENAVFRENFKRWQAIAPDQIQIFDYPMNYATIYEPFFSLDSMVDRVKFFHRNGVKGITFCGQPYMFCRLFMYVLGPLRWDPEQPVKPLETRFLKAYYGPAAASMAELLALARTQINEKKVHQSSSGSGCTLASLEFVNGAYRIFKKAEQASAGKPPYDERVKYEKLCGVLWADLNQYVIKDELHRFSMLKELADICRSAKDPSSVANLPANTGITMARWLDENFSIRQDAEPWYESTAVKELRACAGPEAVKAFVGGLKKRVKCTQVPEGEFLRLPLNGFNVMGPNRMPVFCSGSFGLLLSGGNVARTDFTLETVPACDVFLNLRGLDDDKPGHTQFRVRLNGTVVFDGATPFPEDKIGGSKVKLPAGSLKAGLNTLALENPSPVETFGKWFFIQAVSLSPVGKASKIVKDCGYATGPGGLDTVSSYCAPGGELSFKAADQEFSPRGTPLKIEIVKNSVLSADAIQLRFKYPMPTLKPGVRFKMTLWAKCSQANEKIVFSLVQMKTGHPFRELGDRSFTEAVFSDNEWKPVTVECRVEKGDGCEWLSLPDVYLGNLKPGTVVHLSPVLLEYWED